MYRDILSKNTCVAIFKDTYREKAPLNKTAALTKSTNIDISVVGKSNQLFIRGSFTEQIFRKNNAVTGETWLFVIG